MKYAIVITDGAADLPIEQLGDKTPLEAAVTPNLDRLAESGRVGSVSTTPEGWSAGSDLCCMSLLGYDPVRHHTGRAAIEGAAMGLTTAAGLPEDAWLFRVNLVTVSGEVGDAEVDENGVMLDHSAGGISTAESRVLFNDLLDRWRDEAPDIAEGLELHPATSYRSILVDSSGRDHGRLETIPPHEIPGLPWIEHLPDGGAGDVAERLCRLMAISHRFLSTHDLNRGRAEGGLRPANMAWIWGHATPCVLPPFADLHGLRGAMTTAVDLLAGLANLMGWDLLDVPGATGYHDNDYAGQGLASVRALDTHDLVCCHVESPDEYGHQADPETKVAAIEAIDREIIGPIHERLLAEGDPEQDPTCDGWRMLVLPDHYTLCSTRKHDATPVPFAMAGAWVRSLVQRVMTEAEAEESDLHIAHGHELMEYFLRGGLKTA